MHDYPPWHRLHGKPKPRPKNWVKTSYAYNVNTTNLDAVKGSQPVCFTNAQCQQLMTMIKSGFKDLFAANNSDASTSGMNYP